VHIHAGPEELGRVYAADLLLQAAMACAAKALEALTAPATLPWAAQTAAPNADYDANLESPPVQPLDMAVVIKTISAWLPENTVYTNGAGNFSGWLHRYLRYPASSTTAAPSWRRPRAPWATACRPPWPRRCCTRTSARWSTSPATATS
jgi:thiamine pyrophosphate-dependent acetolactate synthase large subunit-like protein